MVTWEEIVEQTGDWPGLTVDTWYGTAGLKVDGKGFCRMWSEREYRRDEVSDTEVLVVMCDPDEKPSLIESSDGTLFETPHYEGHGAALVRLADSDLDDVLGYVEDAYRLKATAKLLGQFDQSNSDGS